MYCIDHHSSVYSRRRPETLSRTSVLPIEPAVTRRSIWLSMAFIVIVVFAGAASAQTPLRQDVHVYDVCSVKPSGPRSTPGFRPIGAGGFITTIPIIGLVTTAFDLEEFQVVGLPAWATDRYEVACKDTDSSDEATPSFSFSRMRSGIRGLLRDRFHFRYHSSTRRLPIVTLRVGKGGLKVAPSKGSARGGGYGPTFVKGQAWSMAELANALTAVTHEKVIDKTAVVGLYDIDLKWALEDRGAVEELGSGVKPSALSEIPLPRLSDILNERLGLTVSRTTENTEVIIVDHIEKPAAN
jgi:uncharacterized protein (TIGR03435 family)